MLRLSKNTILILSLLTLISQSCEKEYGHLAGIVFTIDDGYVKLWYPYLDYLDSVHFKLTFYITGYHKFGAEEKSMLKKFQDHGHEIAFHTTNHVDLKEFLKNKTANDYLLEEIVPDLGQMNKDSLKVKNFEYPYNKADHNVDRLLLNYFNSIRKIKVSTHFRIYELDEIYHDFPTAHRIIHGAGIDNSYNVTEAEIIKALKRTNEENKVILLCCHRIGSTNDDYAISEDLFRKIIEYCNNNDIISLTVNELLAVK